MCGRFVLLTDLSRVVETFHIEAVRCDYEPLNEVYPGQDVYAVIRDEVNQLVQFHWGLVPSWSKDPSVGKKLINARAETLTEKPSFRGAFQRQRCLIIADGFYEWEKAARKSIPHYYVLKSGAPFGFAGLYNSRREPDGQILRTCAIITTTPNALIRPVHDRMPVIIPKEDELIWLDPAVSDSSRLLPLLCPYPAEAMAERR
jgi:putative SOS response-associated peptidase YedK